MTVALEEIVPLELRQLENDVLSAFEIRSRYSQTVWLSSCRDLGAPALLLAPLIDRAKVTKIIGC